MAKQTSLTTDKHRQIIAALIDSRILSMNRRNARRSLHVLFYYTIKSGPPIPELLGDAMKMIEALKHFEVVKLAAVNPEWSYRIAEKIPSVLGRDLGNLSQSLADREVYFCTSSPHVLKCDAAWRRLVLDPVLGLESDIFIPDPGTIKGCLCYTNVEYHG